MADPTTDPVAFLQQFRPTGFWLLTAIWPDGPPVAGDAATETRPFAAATEAEEARAWIARVNVDRNVYFAVNPVIRPTPKKASRENIAALEYLHVDIDPKPGKPLDEERLRALALLQNPPAGVPPPSFIVDSGGGAWGFWRLRTPLPIDGLSEAYEHAARFNLQLTVLFDADPSCHNVDRIARLPGTVNWPDARKRAKGRTTTTSSLTSSTNAEYDLSLFSAAPLVQSDSSLSGNSIKIDISGNVRRLASLEELPAAVSLSCRAVITQGKDLDNPDRWSSRSEPLWWVCCELVRAGVDDETIYSIITDPGFAISESVLDKGSRVEKYAIKQIRDARENAINPHLRELNAKHAVIGDYYGKCRIISEQKDSDLGRTSMTFQSFQDFWNRYSNQFIEGLDSKGNPLPMEVGKWWTRHPQRRSYERIVFSPGRDVENCYNLWQGFACDARPGKCDLFLGHVQKNICAGDTFVYEYLYRWMACAVQHPDEQGHVAVVMRGRKGTGKGVFASGFGSLFGRHFVPVTNSKHIVGQFNEHLRDCVVLFADEAFAAGDKQHESLLKTMITEDLAIREGKGVNAETARNYIHLLMASNAEWVVPAGEDERRYLMLDVSEGNLQDLEYFGAIKRELNNGGREALLHRLMHVDLSTFDPRAVPKTLALQEQKKHSFSLEQEWWYSKLQAGEMFPELGWPEYVFCLNLAHDFVTYARTWGVSNRSNSTKLGRFLHQVLPIDYRLRRQLGGVHEVIDVDGTRKAVDRPRIYRLPALEEARRHFEKTIMGGAMLWDEPARTVHDHQDLGIVADAF